MIRKTVYITFVCAFIVAFVLSCNLFAPSESSISPDGDKWKNFGPEALIMEGKTRMWEEEWEQAAEYFIAALKKDDKLSEGWFYLGKCVLRISNVDLNQVWGEIKPAGYGKDNVPFLFQPPPGKTVDSELNFELTLHSIRIDSTQAGQITGLAIVDKKYVAKRLIDSVFIERMRIYDAMNTAMSFLERIHFDTTMDDKIKREHYEPDYLIESSVVAVLGIVDVNKSKTLDWDTLAFGEINEREAYRIICQDLVSVDEMEFDSLKQLSKDPRDVKKNLDMIIAAFLKADESDSLFSLDLEEGHKKDENFDVNMTEDLTKMIDEIINILPFYYYDDFIDNDGDYGNGDGVPASDTVNYLEYSDLVKNGIPNRTIWIDWDRDEKIDIYPPGSPYGEWHIGETAHRENNPNLYISLPNESDKFKKYIWKGGYTYEFIAGDWGVDEEILDGEDNDLDGLTDEDTRISADTLDDDGDWYNTDATLLMDTIYNPMIWDDLNSDFLIGLPTVAISQNAEFIEYKILHDSIFAVLGLSAPSSPKRYDNSFNIDFSSGDYGLDEEWYDGLDNDNDGWIDEDVGERLPPESLRSSIISKLISAGLSNASYFINGSNN